MNIMEYVQQLSDVCGVADLYHDRDELIKTYGDDLNNVKHYY